MPLTDLSDSEKHILCQSLRAVADGPFFEDVEFHSLFGVDREDVRQVAYAFPDVDEFDEDEGQNDDTWLIINNTFANLIGYPLRKHELLPEWVSATKEQLEKIYKKWRG